MLPTAIIADDEVALRRYLREHAAAALAAGHGFEEADGAAEAALAA